MKTAAEDKYLIIENNRHRKTTVPVLVSEINSSGQQPVKNQRCSEST